MNRKLLAHIIFLLPATAALAASIVCPADAPSNVKLAAQEVRRYVYLRTGTLLSITARAGTIMLRVDKALQPQQYRLQSDGQRLTITGGDPVAVSYGAYAFAEKLGVRFYLHGDVVPDERIRYALPVLDETRQPLFALRGVNPWGSHPFGFDAWSADDYKAIFTQLAKMRMNFLGVHCYPEGHPYAEPTVWHGLTGDFDARGSVESSYVSRYFNTLLTTAWGGYRPKQTSTYSLGGALLFERDDWAPPALAGHCPLPAAPEACNDVFNRMGTQFREAFTFARELGVKTCVGTEAPLIMPRTLAQRTSDVRAVYEGTFRRIMASHPLDYYWLWTPESWTWSSNSPAQYSNIVADIKIAYGALHSVRAPFQLATAGWVLGPVQDRAAFARDLPQGVAMSAISRDLGYVPVDAGFDRVKGREKWAIPWLESDGYNGLAAVQLVAGRMRRDAADALAYGCTGLMGLHWRTEILAPNISALAQAAWDQSWNTNRLTGFTNKANFAGGASQDHQADALLPRSVPCDDFYADWARANFGQEDIGKVFAAIDGKVPLSVVKGCPAGSLVPDRTPWDVVAPRFAFVDELEKQRPRVHGAGSLDRFDYWLNTLKYHRSLAQLRCSLATSNATEITRLYGDTYRYLLATVNTPGALAMVVNMENHPGWGASVAQHAAQPWPTNYQGAPRLIVPTVRSVVEHGEALALKVIALDDQPVRSLTLHWRTLGRGGYQKVAATHLARAVYALALPPAANDFEYYIAAETAKGHKLVWPVTAPALNQTVVVLRR